MSSAPPPPLDRRQPRSRPRGYSARARETFELLRHVRIGPGGELSLVAVPSEDESFPRSDGSENPPLPLRPSFAALQLYLLNDTEYGVYYIKNPLRKLALGDVDVVASLPSASVAVENILVASLVVGDVSANATAAELLVPSAFERRFPQVFALLRHIVLLRLGGLTPAPPLNKAQQNIMFNRLLINDFQRRLTVLENNLLELRAKLLRGYQLTSNAATDRLRELVRAVNNEVFSAWQSARDPPPQIQIKREPERLQSEPY